MLVLLLERLAGNDEYNIGVILIISSPSTSASVPTHNESCDMGAPLGAMQRHMLCANARPNSFGPPERDGFLRVSVGVTLERFIPRNGESSHLGRRQIFTDQYFKAGLDQGILHFLGGNQCRQPIALTLL